MDYEVIQLIRRRVLKDLEEHIPIDTYNWNDLSSERRADIDFSIGLSIHFKNDSEKPFLTPRQRIASKVLMTIGQRQLPSIDAQSGDMIRSETLATGTDFQLLVRDYMLYLEPCDARPLEDAIARVLNSSVLKPPPSRQRTQELRIHELLSTAGYSAASLPVRKKGMSGVKAEMRKLALLDRSIFSASSFDKAWQRLRENDEIIEAK